MKFYEREPFDDQKVEAIRIHLTNLAASGKPSDYQVILDEMEIVPRTSDVEQFTSFYDLINHKTQNLVINIFSGATRHKRTHAFYFNDGRSSGSLNGVDPQKAVDEQVARYTLDFQNKVLNDQVRDLKTEVVALEEENEQLKEDNVSLREDLRKATSEGGIASTIMGGMERMFDRYLPGQKGLSGPPQNQPQNPPPGTINVPHKEYDQFKSFAMLADQFNPEEFDKVLTVVKFFAENKPAIEETISFLTEDENPSHDDSQEDHH
jgi:hypothetical protein